MQNWRNPEWLQRGLDALKATLDAGDAVKQQMIEFLLEEGFWDRASLKRDAAVSRFNACMNPGKREFFKLTEIVVLMKRFRRYELLYWLCDELGFEQPRKIPAEELRADLLARANTIFDNMHAEIDEIRAKLEHLGEEEGAQELQRRVEDRVRIHPAFCELGPRFARDGVAEPDDAASGNGGF